MLFLVVATVMTWSSIFILIIELKDQEVINLLIFLFRPGMTKVVEISSGGMCNV